jgi:drug/metabolite transporter (DMT)-like permease
VEVLFGGISSLLYGVADFLGGEAAKRVSAATVVLWAGVVSFPMLVIVALVVGGEATPADYLIGAAAGLSGSLGLIMLFAGLSRARAAAVAPVAAAVGAIVPVIAAVLEGERPSELAWFGFAVAIPAVVLCAWAAAPGETWSGGVGYGLVAGVGFGGFTILIRITSEQSNLLPLIASRAATFLLPLLLAAFGAWQISGFRQVPKKLIAANALLDVSANVSLVVALRAGSLAVAAVAASFYPAITVVMARLVNAEHVRWQQALGLALTIVAMSAIALS